MESAPNLHRASAASVSFKTVVKYIKREEFVVDSIISEIDTLTNKFLQYRGLSDDLKIREDELTNRISEKEDHIAGLAPVVAKVMSGPSNAGDIVRAQVDNVMTERTVYDTLMASITARYDSIVADRDMMEKISDDDLRSPTVRSEMIRALNPETIQNKQKSLLDAVYNVESGIQGDARKNIREYLYGVMVTFAASPRGLLDSMEFNYIIMGRAGTGKSHLVRVMATFFHSVGILVTPHSRTINKSDLVAGYLGQSAPKTRGFLLGSLEKCVFLDEAYSLLSCEYSDDKKNKVVKRDAYGTEAIDQIVDLLSNIQGLIVFVVAGYPQEMQTCFLGSNSGLSRRFANKWNLERFSARDLLEILSESLWKIDSSKKYFFKKGRRLFSGGKKEVEFVARKLAPIIRALDTIDAFTAQAADMDTIAHLFYNIIAQKYPKIPSLSVRLSMFNYFLASTKEQKTLRVLGQDANGNVAIINAQGKNINIPTRQSGPPLDSKTPTTTRFQ